MNEVLKVFLVVLVYSFMVLVMGGILYFAFDKEFKKFEGGFKNGKKSL